MATVLIYIYIILFVQFDEAISSPFLSIELHLLELPGSETLHPGLENLQSREDRVNAGGVKIDKYRNWEGYRFFWG